MFDPQRLEVVHVLVGFENGAPVAGLAEQDAAPVVDELGYMESPIDFCNFAEDRFEQFVEHDLAVEANDKVMDRGPRVKVMALICSWFGRSHHDLHRR